MNNLVRVIPHVLGLINPNENVLIRKWGEEAFGQLALCQEFKYQSGSDYCVLAYCGAAFVGFAAVFKREVFIGGEPFSMGCVGGVITSPDYRGKGYGSIMMNELKRLIFRTLGCRVGGLLCEEKTVPFYEKLGWVRSNEAVLVERDGRKVEWPEAFMSLAESDFEINGKEIDLCGLPW